MVQQEHQKRIASLEKMLAEEKAKVGILLLLTDSSMLYSLSVFPEDYPIRV